MADRLIQTGTLTAIADAIRAKTGSSATLTPAQMADAISTISGKVTRTWHQCPQAVRDYLDNVDYTGVAYTESSISQYAPSTAVSSNTKPIGTTVDGTTFYNEEPNKETPFATTNTAGTLKPLDHVRWIHSLTANLRDLGGWACDGGTVKYGLLYRSGNINVQDFDLLVNQLGINTECDLTADGTPAFPDKMRFIGHASYAMYSLSNTGAWITNLTGIFEAVKYGDPVIFHCSMGADRTGTLACVLEGLLGMSQSDIDKDYELTSFSALRARNGNYQGGTADWAHLISQINAYSGSTFRDKVVSFVLSLGFTVSDINTYRHAMVDGNPEDIVEPTYTVTNTLSRCTTSNSATSVTVGGSYSATITANSGYTLIGASVSITMGGTDITSSAYSNGVISIASVTGNLVIQITAVEQIVTYTVTNSLTNCSTSNASSSIGEGQSYTATITANSGYTLDGATVAVTMGGTDITSTAYNNGSISIASATGNISITVSAVEEIRLKELFVPANATLNQRFSSSGGYSAVNGNFCTDFIAVSGLDSSNPWRIHIRDTAYGARFKTSGGQESVLYCKADKSVINTSYGRLTINTNDAGTNTLCKHNDDINGGVYIDINQTGDGSQIPSNFFDLSQVAYIRICMAYSSGTAIPDTATLSTVSIKADNIEE